MSIEVLGFVVWSHHIYSVDLDVDIKAYFTVATLIIAVSSKIKIFNWLATCYGDSLQLTSSMLFAMKFIFMFIVEGLSGVVLANASLDIAFHDTTFTVFLKIRDVYKSSLSDMAALREVSCLSNTGRNVSDLYKKYIKMF